MSRFVRKQSIARLIAIWLLFLLSFTNVYATSGAPAIISYQGRLADSGGTLLGGSSGTTYYFKFSIWDDPTVDLGNRLWPSTAPSSFEATVKNGVFNVNIGDIANSFPHALNYDFNTNQTIYLQVEVSSNDSTFETLSPRQQITASAFSLLSGRVSGTGQSSFGTLTPVSNVVLTIEATSTTAIPIQIRGSVGQTASLLRIEDSSLSHLFSINASGSVFASSTLVVGTSTTSFIVDGYSGNVGVGTVAPARKFSVLHASSNAQLRLSQTSSLFGEFYLDPSGDLQLSSNSGSGGNIRMQDENLWICSGGSCDSSGTTTKGNVVVETAVIFDNNFIFQQIDASTTRMLDTTGATILEFDESDQ